MGTIIDGDGLLRRRITNNNNKLNGDSKKGNHSTAASTLLKAFRPRESVLTVLIESSPHIRAMYHIFVVILLMLLLDTVIFDFIEHGKINIGIRVVIHGFGDIGRGIKIWLFELCIALLLYPALICFEGVSKYLRKYTGILRIWSLLGLMMLLAMLAVLILLPTLELKREQLAVASAVAVTIEMFRFAMKMYAIAIACAPRCLYGHQQLPTFGHYIYYLFAPTLIYRDQYPRTKNIKWGVVLFHFSEVAAIIFYDSFLWERFILPYWSDYGKEPQVGAGTVVRGMFGCVLPGVIAFLCGFYCLLHAWLNAFAEMLTFADRLFYEDWWTQSQFSHFYRSWNLVVYSWLRDHIYKPITPSTGRVLATFIVFLISSIAHELVLALSFGFFYPVLLVEFGVLGLLCVPLSAASGRRFPHTLNILMWLAFFIGNGILWSLYPMEYFARQNCPSSENDSFFVPKSWTCPKIVLKPDWTFHNPFSLIY